MATALVGPLFHLLGMVTRGTSLLNADYARLLMIYVALGLSAAAGMWVALRNTGLWRLVAIIAVLANLASIGYAAQRWTRDMQRSLAEVDLSPMEVGKVGVLVAAGGYAETDLAEARRPGYRRERAAHHAGIGRGPGRTPVPPTGRARDHLADAEC